VLRGRNNDGETPMKFSAGVCCSAIVIVSTLACNRGLSSDEAKRVVESNQVIRRADDHVMIDAISQSSPTEAVVRASISGEMTNLKFRRYDTGWSWEFVETKAGGWIAPDQAIIELREPARLKRVAEWVATFVLELEGKRAGKLGIPLTVLALSIARN